MKRTKQVIIGGYIVASILCYSCQQEMERINPHSKEYVHKDVFFSQANPQNSFVKEYYENDSLLRFYETLDSAKNGFGIEFLNNGQINKIEQFKNNKLNGFYSEFHKNGKVSLIGWIVNGENHGDFSLFYENGKLKKQFTVNRGRLIGPAFLYSQEGRLIGYKYFSKGGLCYNLEYGKNGKAYMEKGVLAILEKQESSNEISVSTIKPPNCFIEKLKIVKKDSLNKTLNEFELKDTTGFIIPLNKDGKTIFDVSVELAGDIVSKQNFSLTF